jgi:ribosome maturation factor RimP
MFIRRELSGPLAHFLFVQVGNMRTASPRLQQLVEPVVTAMGYELVGMEWASRGHAALVRLYIDRPEGITVDDCEKVSHQVSGVLDVEDPIQGPYTLEVSSPGLDRPLFNAAQFARYVGRDAKVRTLTPVNGRRNFRGAIRAVRADSVVMDIDGVEVTLALADIDKANLVPEL